MKNFNEQRGFGVEIEMLVPASPTRTVAAQIAALAGVDCRFAGYTHDTTPHWKIVTDGSLRSEDGYIAIELVSPILYGKQGLRDIERVCGALAQLGAKVNVSCGLHVHHDARDLTLDNWKNLARVFGKHEHTLNAVLPASRRNNRWAQPINREQDIKTFFKKVASATTVRELAEYLSNESRYRTLNTHSFWRHGSVEFRQHGGTVEAEKITQWVVLTASFVNVAVAAKRVATRGAGNFGDVVAMLDAKGRRYFEARRAHFAGAA